MSGARRVEQASSNDLVDLMCDLTGTSMQVAAVLVFQPLSPLDIAVVRQVIAARIAAVPRLVDASFGCGRPFWIDDPEFAIDDHVRPIACAAPGDEQALVDGNLQPGGLRAEVDALQLRIQDRERVEDRGQGPDRPRPARGAAGAPSSPLRGTGRDAHPDCRTTALRSGAARAGAARRAARARCRPRC